MKDSSKERVARLALAVIGAYPFTSALIAAVAVGLPFLSVTQGESVWIGHTAGPLVFLVVAIWIAATKRLLRTAISVVAVAATLKFGATFLVGQTTV